MATVTGSKRHLDITSDTLITSSNVEVGAKLLITTTDTNTTSTSALVLNSTEVETRTLGSLAFSSATYDNYVSWNLKTNDTQRTTVGSGGDLNIVAGTNVGVAYSAGGTVTITSTDTTYSAGTLLDISGTTFNVDLTELSNNTATFAPTQDHFVILDNGVQGKKLASSIFGSAAYEASTAFATASHNHAGVYVPEYEALHPSGSDNEMNVWRKTHAVYSDNSGASTYIIVQTEVPQDNYSMGGFTLVYQDDYNSSGEGGEIKIYGYWNPESNGGFVGFRYECSNPYHTPTIEVCRNSSSGNTAFFISGEGGNYTQLIAKDLWLGYTASSATQQWGSGWVITQSDDKDGYTNFDTLNRNDFAAITTNGSTPSLTGGVSAAEIRTLIGAQVSGSYLTAHPSITEAADVNNSGGTVIQDLTFDNNGHVTATGSVNLDGRYYTETESDARYPRGVTKTYSSVDTASDEDSWYKFFTITDSGNSPVVCYLRGYAHSSVAFIVSEGYQGGNAHVQILDYLASTNNNYKWIKGVRIINNGDVEVLLNGGATVSLEMTIIGDASYVSVPTLSSAASGDVVDSITGLTNGMIRAKGTISGGNTGNWDTAYNWGNHASAGYMSSFILEDGDGTEVSISNGKEVKFVEGTGININWTDTSTGSDSDPYDLTFNIKDNSIGATQINVSGNGSSGQVLTSDGDGTMSWTNKTTNTDTITSVGVSGSEVSGTVTLTGAGATSLSQTGNTIEIRSTNTEYSDATTSTAGLMSTTDKTKLDGIASGAEVNVQADWNETTTTSDAYINNKPTLGTAAASAATDFVAVTGDSMTGALRITHNGIGLEVENSATSGADTGVRIRGARNGQSYSTNNLTSYILLSNFDDNTTPNSYDLVKIGGGMYDASADTGFLRIETNNGTALTKALDIDKNQDAKFYGDIDADGNITGSNLNISNWDTAYGWGDHGDGGYAAGDHSHSAATTDADGFMSSGDKTKLDGIASGADVTPSWVPASDPNYLTSLPSHNHNGIYYTEEEVEYALARINGWEAGYGSGTASNIRWNFAEEALMLKNDTDTSIGAVYKAVWMEAGETKRWTVMIKGSQVTTNGMYIRLYQHDGNLPDGKTHVSNDAQGTFIQEDDRGDTGWYENGAISDSWTVFEREYKAPAAGYVSLVVLNWTGNGTESLFIKTPDIQTVYAKVESGSIGITELAVSDGTNGQVLTTNGNGTLSFSTVTSGGSDTNYYLDGITRGDGTNTLTFSVNGGTDVTYTFGSNAFTSYTDHTSAGYLTEETYTAHEDTSNLSGTYGSTANGTKIDEITVDANGHITSITTGATGNMTGFFVEDGDGTEVQINNSNEWKFVEGGGVDINWTDTNSGTDADPYDLKFTLNSDLRGNVVYIGGNANNYIQFDTTNNRIDFYAGGTFVARMESDGDLHIKGDVIAFSDIFG